MVNPPHMQGMTLPQSTYDKLIALKKPDENFDDVVRKLVEIDLKYHPFKEVVEYEFLTMDNSKVFRVTYGDGKPLVEYYNPNGWDKHISAWEYYPAISEEDKELFIEFIIKPNSFIILQDIGDSIDYGDFIIRKIGNIS